LLTSLQISSVISLLETAGGEILSVYKREDLGTRIKEDDSPVTIADIASDRIIKKGLGEITPGTNVFSEETKEVDYSVRSQWDPLWILDPLDGTKEFIARNGEFCISLGLISGRQVVAGFIHAPVSKESWYAFRGKGAWKIVSGNRMKLPLTKSSGPFRVNRSRSHFTDKEAAYMENLKKYHDIVIDIHGSAIKFCKMAEGVSDVYPKFSRVHEWDVAAGHLIVEESGGVMVETSTLKSPEYNKQDYFQAPFIAFGHRVKNWKELVNLSGKN
jgi:3'(2'), 5'-bisphosphate nucleotidase